MPTTPKSFIGVLYSGENEYAECIGSIKQQTYKNYDIHIYDHLPKFEAHQSLYSAFLSQKHKYDLLIKVDADMVLISTMLFEGIVDKFVNTPDMDVLGIAVLDFFSGNLINGMNCYRNTVSWLLDPNNVNADIVNVDKGRYFYDDKELAPAAFHCKNPSRLQAFHFGVHRGVKIFAPKHSTSHWDLLEDTWHNFLKTNDARIGLALLGAELVYAGQLNKDDIDYNNPGLAQAFEKYRLMDSAVIKREIRKLRLQNGGLLPGDLRRRFLRRKFNK